MKHSNKNTSNIFMKKLRKNTKKYRLKLKLNLLLPKTSTWTIKKKVWQ